MRFLVDAHVSGPGIGRALAASGHDVWAIDQDEDLRRATDADLLELAAIEMRLLVSFNVEDFARLASAWAASERSHAGMILIVRRDHSEFGAVLRAIVAATVLRPDPDQWRNYVAFVR